VKRRTGTILLFLVAANTGYLAFPPYDVPWLPWVAFVPLLALLDRVGHRWRTLILITLLYGAWGYVAGYRWVAYALQEFAGFGVLLSHLLLALFALLGATCLLPVVLLRRLWLGPELCDRRGVVLLTAALWVTMECWWPRLFPWYAGLTQHGVSLTRQLAELAGIHAVSFVVVLVNAALYELALAVRRRSLPGALTLELGLVLVLVAGGLLLGHLRREEVRAQLESATVLTRAALIQGNVPNQEKASGSGDPAHRYRRLTLAAEQLNPDLILWPETALPYFVTLDPDAEALAPHWAATRAYLEDISRRVGAPLLIGALEAEGAPRASGGERNYNSALVIDPPRHPTSSRKLVLIPFGERIPPPLDAWFPDLEERMPRSFRFSAGERARPLQVAGRRVAAVICYEAILPELCRQVVRETGADLLVNLTNDSWFGRTGEPAQHLALSAFRAVELRIPMLRVTNSGVTAYVDPTGEVIDPTPLFEETCTVAVVPRIPTTGATLYARVGSLPVHLLGLLTLGALLVRLVGRRRGGSAPGCDPPPGPAARSPGAC
jgi:apolipoprotein N-acyltransferase